MTIKTDRNALEALPLRLLIVAVVAGLSVVPAAGALQTLQDRSFLDRCAVQLESIVNTAQVVSLEGFGSRRTIDLDFRSDGSLRMDRLGIGGGWTDPTLSSVVLELSSGRKFIRSADEPFVWLATESHECLDTSSPLFTLSLTASRLDGGPLVVCEVIPWTS
ncbi:MAG: hypothetical protein MUO87_09965 [Thermoplasmata archaeon]|nr:hypothetical protein [Thermoplasmata archaeon]